MSRKRWPGNLRWWHVVTVVLVAAAPLLVMLLMWLEGELNRLSIANPTLISFNDYNRMAAAIEIGVVVAMLVPLLWAFTVPPWLDSGSVRFSDRSTPRRRLSIVRMLAWTPCIIMGGIVLVLLIDAVLEWWLRSLWSPAGLSTIWTWLILLATIAWGWLFSRALRRRLVRSQQRARICFNCAYSLAEIPNCQRCPECGQAVESCDSSRPSGEAKDAVARS